MSDAPAAPEAGNTSSGDTAPADEFKPITSQDELNAALKERLTRERSKFSDYSDLKTKAARLDEIEKANQTEAERSAAKVADLEKRLAEVQAASQRLTIATAHGITDADDIRLFLTGTDEETLTEQAKRLAVRSADRKKQGNTVPREGASPQPAAGDGDVRAFARDLFQNAD